MGKMKGCRNVLTLTAALVIAASATPAPEAHARKARGKTSAEPATAQAVQPSAVTASPVAESVLTMPMAPPSLINSDPYVPQPMDRLIERLRSGNEMSTPSPSKKRSKRTARPRVNKTLTQLARAFDALNSGKYGQASQLAVPLERNKEFGDYALWIVGRAQQAQAAIEWSEDKSTANGKAAGGAAAKFRRLIERYPYSPYFKFAGRELGRSELLLGAAQCSQKQWSGCKTSTNEGLQRLALAGELLSIDPEILEAYGNACSRETDDICRSWVYRLAQTYHRNSAELKALTRAANGIIDSLPGPSISGKVTKRYSSPDADLLSFDAAMALYLDQKYGAAQKSFREFLDTYPRSTYRFRARYWLAQAFIQDRKSDEGAKLLESLSKDTPLTYYGLLAALGVGKSMDASVVTDLVPPAQVRDPYLHPWELYRLARGEKLIQAHALQLAAVELKDLRPREPLSNSFLLYLSAIQHECGNHSTSFTILSDLIARGFEGVLTSTVVKMIFPTPYMELIERQAREAKLDPILVLSLIKQESAFDLGANSSTGARGLMQIMPGTFTDVIPETRHGDMANLELNLKAGTKYLSKLVTRYNGNLVLALAAYNAGPGNADKWLKASPPKRNMFEFIEAIPFKETREYVSAIMRNYHWYMRRLRNTTPNLAIFWAPVNPSSHNSDLTTPSAISGSGGLDMPLMLPMPLPSSSPAPADVNGISSGASSDSTGNGSNAKTPADED